MNLSAFKFAKNLAIIISFLSNVLVVNGQNSLVRVKLDTAIITIGDQQKLTVEAKGIKGDKITFPSFKDTLVSHIEVLGVSKIDTVFLPDKNSVILSCYYTITSFDSGYYVIPPLSVVINSDTILTDALLLSVLTLAVDTNKVIKDIKQPYDSPWSIYEILDKIIIAAISLILLSIILYYFIKNRKKKLDLKKKLELKKKLDQIKAIKKQKEVEKRTALAERKRLQKEKQKEAIRLAKERAKLKAQQIAERQALKTAKEKERLDAKIAREAEKAAKIAAREAARLAEIEANRKPVAPPKPPIIKGVMQDGITPTKEFNIEFLMSQRELLTVERKNLLGQATQGKQQRAKNKTQLYAVGKRTDICWRDSPAANQIVSGAVGREPKRGAQQLGNDDDGHRISHGAVRLGFVKQEGMGAPKWRPHWFYARLWLTAGQQGQAVGWRSRR